MKKLMWFCILTLSIILVYSLTENVYYKHSFDMDLHDFDEKFHTKLEDKHFHSVRYTNSSGYKVSYYFTRQFYDEPFKCIQVTEFKNGFDLIDYYVKDVDFESVETFKNIDIPIKIKMDNSVISIKTLFDIDAIYYGLSITYRRTESDDVEIEKAIGLMFQTIDEYIDIENR